MRRGPQWCIVVVGALFCLTGSSFATEPVTLDNVVDPGLNSPDEPIAGEFSLKKTIHFLDSAALYWQKERKCFTCHTNYLYLYARPCVPGQSVAHRQVRSFAEEMVEERWPKEGPPSDVEVVATAAALAFNDSMTTGKLHAATRMALARMWDAQRHDGGWTWLKCDWPPMEFDDYYGVTLAAIAVGCAPEGYARTEIARKGLGGIRSYLDSHSPPTLHERGMATWAAAYIPGLISDEERHECVDQLLALQKKDGGWALATLGNWHRVDGQKQDLDTSDGYGTGFTVFVLRQANVPTTSDAIRRGVHWLIVHQRESGRWFTRSLHSDNHHFITHAGTAMALMALAACDELRESK